MKFTVKWEVHYYENDLKLYCDIDQDEDHVNSLDDIEAFHILGRRLRRTRYFHT